MDKNDSYYNRQHLMGRGLPTQQLYIQSLSNGTSWTLLTLLFFLCLLLFYYGNFTRPTVYIQIYAPFSRTSSGRVNAACFVKIMEYMRSYAVAYFKKMLLRKIFVHENLRGSVWSRVLHCVCVCVWVYANL